VVARVAPGGGTGFLSNGDDRWPSGVLSTSELDLSDGLTVEFGVRLRFTGLHWQELEASVSNPESALLPSNERAAGAALVRLALAGPSPAYETAIVSCVDGAGSGLANAELDDRFYDGTWHRITLVIRPDNWTECYFDDTLLARFPISEEARTSTGVLFLGGRSYETEIYHGPVLVTQGLRYQSHDMWTTR
jgi:hypothetical protein